MLKKYGKRKPLIRVASVSQRTVDGIVFASRLEAKRWSELVFQERIGVIRDLRRQPVYDLILPNGVPIKTRTGRTMRYTADFRYLSHDGNLIIEDVKGYATETAMLRIAVAEAIYGFKVKIVGGPSQRPKRLYRKGIPVDARSPKLDTRVLHD